MGEPTTDLSLRVAVAVSVPATAAFDAFIRRIDDWWVREFTWSGRDRVDCIGIEDRLGGMAYEIGPHGFRVDWGRIVAWEPPQRLVLAWQIAPDRVPQPDPSMASEVEVHFHPDRDGTVVDLEHRYFDRYGADGGGYLRAMTEGWHELLDRYAAVCLEVGEESHRALGPSVHRPAGELDRRG
jgi:uncharacterized protein YndB with AHSA1/START domain